MHCDTKLYAEGYSRNSQTKYEVVYKQLMKGGMIDQYMYHQRDRKEIESLVKP